MCWCSIWFLTSVVITRGQWSRDVWTLGQQHRKSPVLLRKQFLLTTILIWSLSYVCLHGHYNSVCCPSGSISCQGHSSVLSLPETAWKERKQRIRRLDALWTWWWEDIGSSSNLPPHCGWLGLSTINYYKPKTLFSFFICTLVTSTSSVTVGKE